MEFNQDIIKKEFEKAKSKVKEFKYKAEANVIGGFYKNIELMYESELTVNSFTSPIWKLYFVIANELIIKEKKEHLDDITVGIYLEKHTKMKATYEKYKGYSTIEGLINMTEEKNFDGYLVEMNKWNTVLTLLDRGFLVDIKDAIDSSLDEIYDLWEALLNDSFVGGTSEDITGCFDMTDGLDELIVELNAGMSVGLPYYNLPLLNKELNGMAQGNLGLVLSSSGNGKSTFVRSCILPSILENNEKILILVNEEGNKKWQTELLVWVCNNIYKTNIQKYTVRDGKFSKEVQEALVKSANWLKEKNGQIIIVPFKTWRVSTAIKLIKKYHALGVNHAVVDTLKLSSDSDASVAWLVLQQNSVALYDAIKSSNKSNGIHLTCTAQLSKDAMTKRYYTQNQIGVAKNIVDVASTCIMIRDVLQDELPEGKHALKVFEPKGKQGMTKIPVTLEDGKRYQLVFIIKTRSGASNEYQIVLEVDMSRNIYKEIGITYCHQDF